MNRPLRRLRAGVRHLSAVDDFFAKEDPLYREYTERLNKMGEPYLSFSKAMYEGNFGRQMQLADILTFMMISRGTVWEVDSHDLSSYMRIMFYTINQLLLQEHITYFPKLRRKFLDYLEHMDPEMKFLIEDEEYRDAYQEGKSADKPLDYKDDKYVYWAIDHLLPKSVGTAIEFAVYLYLIRNRIGYVAPLLLEQRLLGVGDHIVAPDFIVLRRGRVFGVEVEQRGGTGKIWQSNRFMAETGIPVITASIPNTFPLRCEKCHRWILFCDNIIDKFCDLNYEIKNQKITCDSCNSVVYFGRLETNGEQRHYHLECVKDIEYVKNVLGKEEARKKKLVAYFPWVQGLESLEEHNPVANNGSDAKVNHNS